MPTYRGYEEYRGIENSFTRTMTAYTVVIRKNLAFFLSKHSRVPFDIAQRAIECV